MDVNFRRPQYFATEGMSLPHGVIPQSSTASSAVSAYAMPTNSQSLAPQILDFSIGAKAFQKKRLNRSLANGAVYALLIILIFITALTTTGVLLNNKYKGRALPFTYIGNIPVGGLNQAQIKQLLDERLDGMKITFVDGGLVRNVPITQFDISADTNTASKKAVQDRVNPFSFLNRQRKELDIKLNERYLSGYVDLIINRGKTKSTDATIELEKGKLVIKPEKVGFVSDTKFIVNQIKFALSNITAPWVNVNTVTIKPKVYAKDLEDDMQRINTFAQTSVTLKIAGMDIHPSAEQKLAWANISMVSNSGSANFEFSKTRIRDYLIDLNNKYQSWVRDDQLVTNPDGSTSIKPGRSGIRIESIDDTASAIFDALNSKKPLEYKVAVTYTDYKKLDPSLTTPAVQTQTNGDQLITMANNY